MLNMFAGESWKESLHCSIHHGIEALDWTRLLSFSPPLRPLTSSGSAGEGETQRERGKSLADWLLECFSREIAIHI